MRQRLRARRRGQHERGASLVEFALILPLFMALILGMFSGGISYNRKLSLTGAAREASRYGATLQIPTDGSNPCAGLVPSNSGPQVQKFLRCVSKAAQQTATSELNTGISGRAICVAYITGNGVADTVTSLTSDAAGTETFGTSACYADALTGVGRVQVQVQRNSTLEYLFASSTLHLKSASSSRYER